MTDVTVRDTLARLSDGAGGQGLHVESGAEFSGERVLLFRNCENGVSVVGAGSALRLSSLTVQDTLPRSSDRGGGVGLAVSEGGVADVTASLFERNRSAAMFCYGSDTVVRLVDLRVADTLTRDSDGTGGYGIAADERCRVTIQRAQLDSNTVAGVIAQGEGTALELFDIAIRDTRSDPATGQGGRGALVQGGARLDAHAVVLERNHELGISASGPGSVAILSDAVIRQTLPRECASTTCADSGAGSGVGSFGGAQVEGTRIRIVENALCGLQLAHGNDAFGVPLPVGGTADLRDGEVAYNAVCGANVQTDGFDIDRLMDNVLYHDNNGQNLDMTELPVPEVGAP